MYDDNNTGDARAHRMAQAKSYVDLEPQHRRPRFDIDEPSDARIQAQLGFMHDQLSITEKMFAELSMRMEPVLIPEMDDACVAGGDVPRKMASEISNTLDDLNGQIIRLQGRITRVIERVQL